MQLVLNNKSCRVCGSREMEDVLDLGNIPLANRFIDERDLSKKEIKYKLLLRVCRKCYLCQLSEIVKPNLIYENYAYYTSANKPIVDHFKLLAREIESKYIKSKDDLVFEIGSNDGTLLSFLKNKCRVLGIDPAKNITNQCEVATICDYFNTASAQKILNKYGQAKVILANNVIAHIDNLNDVLTNISSLLCKDGVFIFEVHWAGNLIKDSVYDQIYHEHLSFFNLSGLRSLVENYNLKLVDAKVVSMQGESLLCYVKKSGKASARVKLIINKEKKIGLFRLSTYNLFRKKVNQSRLELIKVIKSLKEDEKKIVGYGAPAKGNILLNYCGINSKHIDYIVDTTEYKQGMYAPGSKIKVVSPEILKRDTPDYILVLSWNYLDHILKKERALRKKGVKFILPLPRPKLI